jgi:hypothetical protein
MSHDLNRWHFITMASMISLKDITKTYHLESLAKPLGTRIDVPVLKRVNLSILLTEMLRQRTR